MSSSLARALVATLTIAAGPALAGGLGQPVVVPPVAPPAAVVVAPSTDWTGGYAGVQASAGTLSFDETDGFVGVDDAEGTLLGVHAGYQRDFGRFVLGGEVQFDSSDIDSEFLARGGDAPSRDLDSVLRAGVRAGFDGGRFMPYVTGGYVGASLDGGDDLADLDLSGGYFGVGVDYRLRDSVTLGAQVLQSTFDEVEGTTGLDGADLDTVGLRATYNF